MNNYEIRRVKKDDDKELAFIQVESWKKAYWEKAKNQWEQSKYHI